MPQEVNRTLGRAPQFWEDYSYRYRWYFRQGGEELAQRFARAVEATLPIVLLEPSIGHIQRFKNPRLRNLRSIQIIEPFDKLLIFYRIHGDVIQVWRIMHGAQNLGRRLLQPNREQ